MIIDLIREERMRNFPLDNYSSWVDEYFHFHCSPAVASALRQEFDTLIQKSGFVVERTVDEPDPTTSRFVKYQIPNLGLINVLQDMLQGYRLEKVGHKSAEIPITLVHTTVIKGLGDNKLACMDNYFSKDDTVTDGKNVFKVLEKPEELYEGGTGGYYVYQFDHITGIVPGAKLFRQVKI